MELVDIAISAIAESAASQKRFSWSGMVDPLGFLGSGCGKDNSVHRSKSAMEYCAVSDVAPPKLERFAQLVRESSSTTSRLRD
jgi:hypothetical protein